MQNIHGESLNEYYVSLFRENFRRRKERLNALRTKEDALAYRDEVRRKIRGIFKLPSEKIPLEPVTTKITEHHGVTIEHLYFYSRPGLPVTANLYYAAARKNPSRLPAVLYLMGHNGNGKAASKFFPLALAEKGFAVLVPDPIGQGERIQFTGVEGVDGHCVFEHNILGKQQLLCGDFFGTWRVWDAIRSLDYLCSRPEVDTSRVAVAGCSGGGTLTTWLNALDDRPALMSPSCYITSWKRNVENELPVDVEQVPPGAVAAGLEMSDFLIAAAPRPMLILGAENDFFDPRGTTETFEELRRFYALLGCEEDVRMELEPGGHGYRLESREAFYRFALSYMHVEALPEEPSGLRPLTFRLSYEDQQLSAEPSGLILLTDPQTFVCDGSVFRIPGTRHVGEFSAELAGRLNEHRTRKTPEELRAALKKRLGAVEAFVPDYRVLRGRCGKKQHFSRFALETEPGRPLCVLKRVGDDTFFHLPEERGTVRLYLAEFDCEDELAGRMPEGGEPLYGLDMRGLGECTPSGTDQPEVRDFFNLYQFDYHFASLGLFLNRPVLAGKVQDILCTLELPPFAGAGVTLEARGLACYPALIAALLVKRPPQLELSALPQSWGDAACVHVPELPMSSLIPGILEDTDLPELIAAVSELTRVNIAG